MDRQQAEGRGSRGQTGDRAREKDEGGREMEEEKVSRREGVTTMVRVRVTVIVSILTPSSLHPHSILTLH